MQRIKDSGKAGVIAYAIVVRKGVLDRFRAVRDRGGGTSRRAHPLDFASDEGKAAIGADAFIFINFARLIVPARIAFALGLAPWVDENPVKGGEHRGVRSNAGVPRSRRYLGRVVLSTV